ncbi:MAG: hypothetical protein EZS28_045833 [Streblomastix strix]|uniref:Uncharacterized protein n=1 Tax=Streblomastix strix TaxID=222440 RepID=A0A5J4TL12_9EUKA|nr:MAG: hypothetical protein EZS28_045833 [Streblomastix strix]
MVPKLLLLCIFAVNFTSADCGFDEGWRFYTPDVNTLSRSSIAQPLYYETAILGRRDWMLPRAVYPYGSAIIQNLKKA